MLPSVDPSHADLPTAYRLRGKQDPVASATPASADAAVDEPALRGALGIPEDATRVLVFSESSHWDTNWLQTSEEYFKNRLEPIFAKVILALERDPLRIYCIESVFFLKLFWERHPERQEELRTLIHQRRLRVLSSSFTTPDTLLPHPEAILRDFLLGQEWLRNSGLSIVPRTAYFPDNFGHSPHLPSLMRSVGVQAVGVTRIDGMYFIASDFRRKGAFPLKGSTAEILQKELKTLDFVWKDDDGAEVLCHWNAFTYFQGDMLAHAGFVRWNGHVVAIPWRTRGHISRRIDRFVRQLAPLSLTPYSLCPIGMDFNDPILDLRELLERYNRERYPSTGTWAVLAGLDDYFELIGAHREELPIVSVDPNPYWMGFYSSRQELKQRPTRVARSLLLCETLSALAPPDAALEVSLREAWLNLVLMNHHDAVTGTSPDRVCHDEQHGWLDIAEKAASRALSLASADASPEAGSARDDMDRRSASPQSARWWREGDLLHVEHAHYRMAFSERQGGCLTSLWSCGHEQLKGVGLDLVAFSDEGGLWRLGHEFRGGRFVEVDRASARPAKIDVRQAGDTLSVVIVSDLAGMPFTRTITCREGEPFLHVSVAGAVGRRLTVTCRSEIAEGPTSLDMDTIGGQIERPHERVHQPTFWPVPSLVSLAGPRRALHVGFEAPTAVSLSPDLALDWIVARNASKERAFRCLPVLAHPIGGTADELQTHHAALFVTAGRVAPAQIRQRLELAWLPVELQGLKRLASSEVRCDDPAVSIAAMKRADKGSGIIVRLVSERRPGRTVRVWLPSCQIRAAFECDARENDGRPLEIHDGCAVVPLSFRLTSVRLIHGASAPL
jgi:hypothetical protein